MIQTENTAIVLRRVNYRDNDRMVTLLSPSRGRIDAMIRRAYFISPIVDMEKLILDMAAWDGITEKELEARGRIRTSFGEELSWEYLRYVREHRARLTVMETGEHWFHTGEEMRFLDRWITERERCARSESMDG